jgi:hypothetical protein
MEFKEPFTQLADTSQLMAQGWESGGWNSIHFVKLDQNTICYLLYSGNSINDLKIIVENENTKKDYNIFEDISSAE